MANMNTYMTIYATLFWLWFVYGAINGKNRPAATLIAIIIPVPFILHAMGIV